MQLILNGDPSYIAFNRGLFDLACLLERMTDLGPLQFARVHLLGLYQRG
ncbi:MAG: hypothetical protein ACREOL_06730 [Candidatus Dormibacteria bacterium]